MDPDLTSVIKLQSLDAKIKALKTEIAALPKHIAAIEKSLDANVRKLEAQQAALAANQRERKSVEAEIKDLGLKASKLKSQMMEAKSNEQYRAFQNEIDFSQKEIRKCEDRMLDLMSDSEPLQQNVSKAEAELKEEKSRVEADKKDAQKQTAKTKQSLDELTAERARLVAGVKPAIYNAYERIRKRRGGIAVAEAIDGRCSACHLSLRPQVDQDLRIGKQVMFCESCGRILYYIPVVDGETGQPAGTDVIASK